MESGPVDRWQGARYKRRVGRHVAQLTYLMENVIDVAFLLSAWCVDGLCRCSAGTSVVTCQGSTPNYRRVCRDPESSLSMQSQAHSS